MLSIFLARNDVFFTYIGAFLVAQLGKNPPTMQESLVPFLGQEDSLENEMATHSSIPA